MADANYEDHSDEDELSISSKSEEDFVPSKDFDEFIESEIFDFLDIADLPTSNERHNALVKLKIDFAVRFKLAESFFVVQSAYMGSEKDEDGIAHIAKYRNKMAILKKQIGI